MLSDEVRRRLELLQQSNSTALSALPRPISPSNTSKRAALPDGDVVTTSYGSHYRIRAPIAKYWRAGAAEILAAAKNDAPAMVSPARHDELQALARDFPRRALFLDLETCGLAGSMVFLIGLLWHDGDGLAIDQLLARDYSEEQPILQSLGEIVAKNETLVTFNGKSFDWPMVQDRATLHRLPLGRDQQQTQPLIHCDLLHHARRQWKDILPDCKLQTLEQKFCNRSRRGDIPGAEIPAAYHQFVKTGHAGQLRQILEHNALDLLTLAQVAVLIIKAGASSATS